MLWSKKSRSGEIDYGPRRPCDRELKRKVQAAAVRASKNRLKAVRAEIRAERDDPNKGFRLEPKLDVSKLRSYRDWKMAREARQRRR